MDECVEDELALDLVDRAADKVRNNLIYSQSTGVHRILRGRMMWRSCMCKRGHCCAPVSRYQLQSGWYAFPEEPQLIPSKIWFTKF